MMKLYLLSQDVNNGYDTYDCCVVAAENEDVARRIHPAGNDETNLSYWDRYNWAPSEKVMIRYLGEAVEGTKPGVICASFNAG